jgi:NadR type nicotinamide-nucleotide adenylyltransferase
MIDGKYLFCFYGPESTGKSVMAKNLAARYNTTWVPEVAREMVTSNHFNREDIISIGRAQTQRIYQQLKKARVFLICDTDIITTQIYSRHYLKVVPPVLYELEKLVSYDRYFLFDIDVPWVDDGLRDLKDKRQEMMQVFQQELNRRNIEYILVQGDWAQREQIIGNEIDKIIKN